MNEKLDEFLSYIKVVRGFSIETINSYHSDLINFNDYLITHNINYLKFTYEDMRTYLVYLNDHDYTNKTISRHISSIRSFYKYLLDNEYIDNNPISLISNPKKEQKLPFYLTVNDIERLFESQKIDDIYDIRNYLIMEMFYSCGIRLNELINIKLKDVSDDRILVHGKGSKDRYVLYGSRCKKALNNYLKNSREILNTEDIDYLFINNHGKQLTRSNVEYIFRVFIDKSCLKGKLTPHMLRHSFATHMLDNGASLVTVKKLLGHENLETTSIYTHISNEHLRDVYRHAHPRNKR